MLAAVLLVCGVMQLEPANPQSVAWLAICASARAALARRLTR